MKRIKMGCTTLSIPAMALGIMRMNQKSVPEAQVAIQAAYDAGINFIDSADIYGDGKSEEIPPFEGETFGYVLKGFVDLHIGDKVQKLKRGETFYFEAKANHHLENNSRTEAKVLWISSPPNF